MKVASVVVLALLLSAPVAAAQEPALPPDTIARVEQLAILKADFDHWLTIAAATAKRDLPAPGTPEHRQLSDSVVQLLVSFLWIEGEARERGIVVSEAAVLAAFTRDKRRSFPRERDYQKFLAESGQTEADMLRRVRLELVSDRLRERAVAGAKTDRGQRRRLDRYVARFSRRWRKRTVCGEPYAITDCGRTAPIAAG
jgi:hypothetical protein